MRVQESGALPLHSKMQDISVSELVRLKSTQDMCTNPTLTTYSITTSNFWISKICQTLISSPQDFLVNLLALMANAKGSRTAEATYFKTLLELSNSNALSMCSLKIPQHYSTMTTAAHSGKYYKPFGKMGIMHNGKLLTADISSHKTEEGSTLSQVLQKRVRQRYFLSHTFLKQIHKQLHKEQDPNQSILKKKGVSRGPRKRTNSPYLKENTGS